MGLLISRFRRQKTTVETLEGIDKEIANLQKYRRKNQENQKKFIASLILYSIVLYIIGAVVFFLLYFPVKWRDRIIHSIPLLIFPLLVWMLKKVLHWHYVKKTSNTDIALVELREQRKQILEDVTENETYKKAKEILEKFDPARFKQMEKPVTSPTKVSPTEIRSQPTLRVQQQPVNRGVITTPRHRAPVPTPSPMQYRPRSPQYVQRTPLQTQQHMMTPASHNGNQMWMRHERPLGPPLPRSLLPRERSSFDKAVDYLFGDGPQNRYALICRQCSSHNGMALKEEFEYLSFRCCYCYTFNTARRQKPNAPKLEFPTPIMQKKKLDNSKNQISDSSEEDEEKTPEGNKDDVGKKVGQTTDATQKQTTVVKSNVPDSTTPNTEKKSEIIPPASKPSSNENLVQRKIVSQSTTNKDTISKIPVIAPEGQSVIKESISDKTK